MPKLRRLFSVPFGIPLDLCDIVAGEGAEDASPLRGAHEPTIVAFLHNEHNIAYKTIQKQEFNMHKTSAPKCQKSHKTARRTSTDIQSVH